MERMAAALGRRLDYSRGDALPRGFPLTTIEGKS
jgi:hypothetical protein